MCVGTSVSAHVCEFPSLWQIGQTYMWKCVRGAGSSLYRRGGRILYAGAIFSTPWKTAPSSAIFPWRQQNWVTPIWQPGSNLATTCAPRPLSLLMSNCNRPHIRATARADHSCSSQHNYFVMNMLAKTNLLTSWTVFQAETKPHKRLQKLAHNLHYCPGRMIFQTKSKPELCLLVPGFYSL